MLLLHGWPQHWYCWRLVIPELAKHYRVLAMDLRGFGWTDIAWEGLDKETMADDVANVMGALEIDRARIVGHDWGGWIGYLLAIRRPSWSSAWSRSRARRPSRSRACAAPGTRADSPTRCRSPRPSGRG